MSALLLLLILIILSILQNTKSDEYGYQYKSIIYDKSYENSPTRIYTNYDGNVVITGDTLGNILRTTDYGKTWDQSKTLFNGTDYLSISGLVMNSNGKEMLVSTDSNMIFYSKNYGKTFNVRSTTQQCSIMAASKDLTTIACIGGAVKDTTATVFNEDDVDDDGGSTLFGDDDGTALDGYNHNEIYYSSDSGYTWSKSDAVSARWIGLLSNDDGSWIVGVIRHKLEYTWASSDGGATFTCINDEEINDWGDLCGSKNLATMLMTDSVSKNVHISVDYGYSWTQVYNGASLDDSVTINSCAVSKESFEDGSDDDTITIALGFTGTNKKVVVDCEPHVDKNHCAESWEDTGDEDVDTYGVALTGNGKFFYSVDASTMKVASGLRSKSSKKNEKN